MQVKTYRGKNANLLLKQVKYELGDNAVILSTHTYEDESGTICEMTAALEGETEEVRGKELEDDAGSRPGWGEWHREWDEIKAQLMALMRPQLRLDELTPRQRMALEFLSREGVGEGVLMDLWQDLKKDPQGSVLTGLGRIVRTRPLLKEDEKFFAVSGPGGAGKSLSLLRAALSHSRANPDSRILIANADSAQGKGRLFLKHYAELSRMYYAEISGWSEEDILALDRKFDKIFIDLPSLPGDLTLEEHLTLNRLHGLPNLAVHLVLSPHYANRQLDSFLRKYKSAKTVGLIWTKCDEACIFGALVNVAYSTGVPISGISFGSGLRGSMVQARGIDIWRILFKHELPEAPQKDEKHGGYPH
jgi:flagellar biosynthesis protein FlhF